MLIEVNHRMLLIAALSMLFVESGKRNEKQYFMSISENPNFNA